MKRFSIPILFSVTSFCVVILVGVIWYMAQTSSLFVQTERQEDPVENGDVVIDSEDSFLGYIVVHVEPESDELMQQYWPDLIDLVDLADAHGAFLTLHFSASWSDFLQSVPERLELVHEWDRSGHEIGLHHHGYDHAAWDGYSNERQPRLRQDYLGDIDDLLALIEPLSATDVITSGSMSEEDVDWPEGVLVNASQISPVTSSNDLVTTPEIVTYDDQEVVRIGKAGYAVDKPIYTATLEDITSEVEAAQDGEVIGLVIADPAIATNWSDIEALFDHLDALNISIVPVTQLAEPYK